MCLDAVLVGFAVFCNDMQHSSKVASDCAKHMLYTCQKNECKPLLDQACLSCPVMVLQASFKPAWDLSIGPDPTAKHAFYPLQKGIHCMPRWSLAGQQLSHGAHLLDGSLHMSQVSS